ncbi:MAG: magnesium chelatase [Desulfococcus sp. 4484_241]|nr:MAG: magnesium chelatase [Desulfococcus sp. 4484_241]
MFRFASPEYFICLVLIPVLVVIRRRRLFHPPFMVPRVDTVAGISPSPVLATSWIVPFLKYTALVLLIVAMARPQWGTRRVNVITEGVNMVLAVDVSGSMAALDFRREGKIINRLEAVKGVVRDFILKRSGDRIGLVVFGTYAFTQVPLTRDYNTILFVLDRLKIGSAGDSTAIGDAIGISLKRLRDIPSKSNVIILLTDGQSNAGEISPETAAELAAKQGVKIYTIGVGSRGLAPFPVNDPVFGRHYVYRQVNIDEKTLKEIAAKTGGRYFRADNTDSLKKIYKEIDSLEKTRVKVKDYTRYKEYYPYLLVAAFILLLLGIVLENTRYLRVP